MKAFTEIQNKEGAVIGNYAMNVGATNRGDAAPNDVRRIRTDQINIGQRARPIDPATVDKLIEDIGMHGMLQPVGVRATRTGYELIYGAHRVMAFQKAWAAALKAKAASPDGDKDPAVMKQLRIWEMIPAVIYDADIPRGFIELKEIAENLIRKELTKDEAAFQVTKYNDIVKKLGLVISADEKRQENAKNQHTPLTSKAKPSISVKEGLPQNAEHPKPTQTASEKTMADLGVSGDKLTRSHERVNALARAVARDKGEPAPVPIKPESKPSPETERTLALAEEGITNKVQVEKEGKSSRNVHPVTQSPVHEIIVRIDLSGPEKLVAWLKGRLTEEVKPISLDWLKQLHRGIGEVIAEAEGVGQNVQDPQKV